MRMLAPILLAALVLTAATAAAQERTVSYTTSVTPEEYTFQSGQFQKDANGEYVRNDQGSLMPVKQFVTLTVEADMQCLAAPDDETITFGASGEFAFVTEDGVRRYILDLSPRNVTVAWQQATVGGPWTASGEFQIEVISQSKPQKTIESEFTWHAEELDIPQTCPQDSQDPSVGSHTIIVPGSDLDGTGSEDPDDPDDPSVGTPSLGPLGILAALGLAVAMRRRD